MDDDQKKPDLRHAIGRLCLLLAAAGVMAFGLSYGVLSLKPGPFIVIAVAVAMLAVIVARQLVEAIRGRTPP